MTNRRVSPEIFDKTLKTLAQALKTMSRINPPTFTEEVGPHGITIPPDSYAETPDGNYATKEVAKVYDLRLKEEKKRDAESKSTQSLGNSPSTTPISIREGQTGSVE